MTTPLSRDIGDQLGRIGRHWGWLLFFGILMVAALVAARARPLLEPMAVPMSSVMDSTA